MKDNKFERLWARVGFLFIDRPKRALEGQPVKQAFKEIVRSVYGELYRIFFT